MARRKKTETLTDQQKQVIAELGNGTSKRDAAAAAGVSIDQVNEWLRESAAFLAARNQQQQDHYNDQVEQLRSLAGDAIETLTGLLQSENESVRLRTAATVLKCVDLVGVTAPSGKTTVDEVEHEKALDSMFQFSMR